MFYSVQFEAIKNKIVNISEYGSNNEIDNNKISLW